MEPIKRKRITRVGSGAFSIYLPKKWIDSWPEAQQENREVDLHRIGDSLLIVPAITEQRLEATIEPSKKAVRRWLLSGYLRGNNDVTLLPEGGAFDNDAISAGRDFLRHLDERLIASCTAQSIGYRLNTELPPPAASGDDILAVMAAKVAEMIDLAEQAVTSYGVDPDRCLHALALLQATHEEDVSRYFHQAMRMVATLELPLETVSDFQVLDLVAADLHRMADHLLRMASTILQAYGLGLEDLAYPREHLMKQIGTGAALAPIAVQILRTYPRGFDEARELFARLTDAIARKDTITLADVNSDAYDGQDAVQQRIFRTIVDNWGTGDVDDAEAAMAGFVAYQLSVPLTDVVGAMGTTARHCLGLLTAAPGRVAK